MKFRNELKDYAKRNYANVKANGYYNSYEDNIFGTMDDKYKKMFANGKGNEFKSHAMAPDSSSMLAYNFFHGIDDQHKITFRGVTYHKAIFEAKFCTLIGRNSTPANMDVVLIGNKSEKKHVLFIESKFSEYIHKQSIFKIGVTYSKEKYWFDKDVNWSKVLSDVPQKTDRQYYDGLKQIITHLSGIHGFLNKKESEDLTIDIDNTVFEFATMVFEPNDKYEESKDYEAYYRLFSEYLDKIKENTNLKVLPQWISYSEWWKEVKDQYPEDLRNYLQEKYMNLAE